jgi:hypothetical protein
MLIVRCSACGSRSEITVGEDDLGPANDQAEPLAAVR